LPETGAGKNADAGTVRRSPIEITASLNLIGTVSFSVVEEGGNVKCIVTLKKGRLALEQSRHLLEVMESAQRRTAAILAKSQDKVNQW
jgi:hypothetical protein